MKGFVKFLLTVCAVIAVFCIYLYFDDQRQHKIMTECEQLIPSIEASIKDDQYPTRNELSPSLGYQLLTKCLYTPVNSGYRFAVAGTTFNFSLYIYFSEEQRWIHD